MGQAERYNLSPELADDWWEVEALFDQCFAPGREALSSYRLRDGLDPVPGLSIVARDPGGILAGAVRYWPVRIASHDVLLLGPIAVHPTRQGEGLAGQLIRESVGLAKSGGWKRVMLVGDESYYGRYGFLALKVVDMPPPTNRDRILGLALVDGAWQGINGTVERSQQGPDNAMRPEAIQ